MFNELLSKFDSIYNKDAITSHITALQVLEMQIITISKQLNQINSEIMSRLFVQLEFLFILGGGMTTIVLMICTIISLIINVQSAAELKHAHLLNFAETQKTIADSAKL